MSFRVALTGMNAASTDLAVTAHNIANSNTTGFKRSRAEFADLFPVTAYGVAANATGAGVKVARVAQQFAQGSISATNNALDLAISGEGFFTVANRSGDTAYTRAGAFGTDRDGNVVNASGQRLQVYPPVDGGADFDTANMRDLQISIRDNPPRATTGITAGLNFPASAQAPTNPAFDKDDPQSYNFARSLTVFDSLGTAHTSQLFFVKDGVDPNKWDVHTLIDDVDAPAAAGSSITVEFDSFGRLTAPANGVIELDPVPLGNGAEDLTLKIDVGRSTQFGDNFSLSELTQNGITTGHLAGLEITQEGIVQARFTNGEATPLGKVAMATFANPQGLRQLGDTSWGETFQSGQPLGGTAGDPGFGLIEAGSLEASNVDLTEQLVNMIIAQRTFQANAQMITTQDQITQTVINLR